MASPARKNRSRWRACIARTHPAWRCARSIASITPLTASCFTTRTCASDAATASTRVRSARRSSRSRAYSACAARWTSAPSAPAGRKPTEARQSSRSTAAIASPRGSYPSAPRCARPRRCSAATATSSPTCSASASCIAARAPKYGAGPPRTVPAIPPPELPRRPNDALSPSSPDRGVVGAGGLRPARTDRRRPAIVSRQARHSPLGQRAAVLRAGEMDQGRSGELGRRDQDAAMDAARVQTDRRMTMKRLFSLGVTAAIVWSGLLWAQPAEQYQPQEKSREEQISAQQKSQVLQPGNNAPVWRNIQSGAPNFTTVDGPEAEVLIQPPARFPGQANVSTAGEAWRLFRNGPVTFYGGALVVL